MVYLASTWKREMFQMVAFSLGYLCYDERNAQALFVTGKPENPSAAGYLIINSKTEDEDTTVCFVSTAPDSQPLLVHLFKTLVSNYLESYYFFIKIHYYFGGLLRLLIYFSTLTIFYFFVITLLTTGKENIAIITAQGITEPLTQASLSSFHLINLKSPKEIVESLESSYTKLW
ncbi:hypothetical protein CONCODRAFT_7386 [Conidiobolus coronatus NRRL 28638]|uniref:Uncharacterized protein n=1 Tax=Conidiobolus coronatus (strain ATCC 28846 / CBS 209.66 / NRRL 28638) TaxID=796925 RepID=A0A137P562_CONC2|nr:hypothetical protein CONCODRAFT_7386 [Conidiobolus coronatus NRRL 28638]|eukprot:KXN70143.1 hypothetical protein CONCODRAFT_7386 [Conidiobolus coronatus NRRL 28638]